MSGPSAGGGVVASHAVDDGRLPASNVASPMAAMGTTDPQVRL